MMWPHSQLHKVICKYQSCTVIVYQVYLNLSIKTYYSQWSHEKKSCFAKVTTLKRFSKIVFSPFFKFLWLWIKFIGGTLANISWVQSLRLLSS